jgi:hypothetical protein
MCHTTDVVESTSGFEFDGKIVDITQTMYLKRCEKIIFAGEVIVINDNDA